VSTLIVPVSYTDPFSMTTSGMGRISHPCWTSCSTTIAKPMQAPPHASCLGQVCPTRRYRCLDHDYTLPYDCTLRLHSWVSTLPFTTSHATTYTARYSYDSMNTTIRSLGFVRCGGISNVFFRTPLCCCYSLFPASGRSCKMPSRLSLTATPNGHTYERARGWHVARHIGLTYSILVAFHQQ
jgi:hypothetical protein